MLRRNYRSQNSTCGNVCLALELNVYDQKLGLLKKRKKTKNVKSTYFNYFLIFYFT